MKKDVSSPHIIGLLLAAVLSSVIFKPATSGAGELTSRVSAPDFQAKNWLNSPPLRLAELHGKVVLVDFWEYTCINCIRTFPYLRRWNDLYRPLGLVIVGVHTPEFEFGKNPERVADATRRFGFDFPVAIDSDYKIWYAFHNEG